MWTRSELKERAKNVLRTNYWQAFLISLVIVLTGGAHNRGGAGAGGSGGTGESVFFNDRFIIFVVIGILILVILRIIIGYALEVGGRKFFIKAAEGDSSPVYLAFAFREGKYAGIFLTMLLRSIYIFLWSLLLVIPGIIKSYAYR
ncbi:MAG: DUF975 family protein, partial [Halanaerobiales bacterium]